MPVGKNSLARAAKAAAAPAEETAAPVGRTESRNIRRC